MSSDWFDVDKAGLAQLVERRGKAFAIHELVQNAWDSGASQVEIKLESVPGEPYALLSVTDNGQGFEDLEDARRMFGRSRRAGDPEKRGRFSLGEKLVLACCRRAKIVTTTGSLTFQPDGSVVRGSKVGTVAGTMFEAEIRMTRDELAECSRAAERLIPPVNTVFNGSIILAPAVIRKFQAKLPTEFADETGAMRRTSRVATVEVYNGDCMGGGMLYELGVPVVETDNGWLVNVLQKVPLNFERDNVTPGFLRSIETLLLNAVYDRLTEEDAARPWVSEAVGDSRAAPAAVQAVVAKRFGERAVIGSPADPLANAAAAGNGYTVVPGGALSGAAWANVKKHQVLVPASKAFPTPTPAELARTREAAENAPRCDKCGQIMG